MSRQNKKSVAASLRVGAPIIISVFMCSSQAASLEIPGTVDEFPRPVSITDFVTLREIGGMHGTGLSVSPDGRFLAFEMHQADIATNDYRVAWFVAPTRPGSAALSVADGGDPTLFKYHLPDGRLNGSWVAEYAKWSPDSSGVAYRKRVDGETQVWWSSRDGNESIRLTENAADVDNFFWSRDGSRIYFTTDATRKDLREARAHRNRVGHVFDYEKDWSTIDGKPVYPPYLLTGGKAWVWTLDLRSQLERLATVEELAEYEQITSAVSTSESLLRARHIALSGDGSKVAWTQPDDPRKQGVMPPQTLYASHAADGSDPIRCAAPECTGVVDHNSPLRNVLGWSSTRNEVFFARSEGTGHSKRSLYGWHVGGGHVRRVLTMDEWISDCSIVRDRAVCFRETPSHPRTVISIDLNDGSIETLVDPNPEFRNLMIGEVDLFEWESSHGVGTFGYLVKPPGYIPGRRYPLVIVGYLARFALRGGVGDEYPVHALAANGFVVLVYQKPAPQNAEEIFSERADLGRAMWGEDLFDVRMPLASFESAIQVLADSELVDPTRVAITGLSAGVADVNYSIIHSDLFSAAITSSSDYGPSSWVLTGPPGWVKDYRRVIGMGPYPGPHGFLFPHISLALNADRVSTPLLVHASDAEHSWALEEVAALISSDKPVEMVVYPGEGHVKWHPAHRVSLYERNVDWLKFWLQGVEDSNPNKVLQYVRWRKLRDKHVDHGSSDFRVDRTE